MSPEVDSAGSSFLVISKVWQLGSATTAVNLEDQQTQRAEMDNKRTNSMSYNFVLQSQFTTVKPSTLASPIFFTETTKNWWPFSHNGGCSKLAPKRSHDLRHPPQKRLSDRAHRRLRSERGLVWEERIDFLSMPLVVNFFLGIFHPLRNVCLQPDLQSFFSVG